MTRRPLFFLISGLVLGLVWGLYAADITWDDGEPADHNWSSPNNWSSDQIPGPADVVLFTSTSVGTNVVDQEFVINGLIYNNATGRFDTVISDGTFLTVSNYLRVGSTAPSTSRVRISGPGGTLRMRGDIQVSGTNTGSLVIE